MEPPSRAPYAIIALDNALPATPPRVCAAAPEVVRHPRPQASRRCWPKPNFRPSSCLYEPDLRRNINTSLASEPAPRLPHATLAIARHRAPRTLQVLKSLDADGDRPRSAAKTVTVRWVRQVRAAQAFLCTTRPSPYMVHVHRTSHPKVAMDGNVLHEPLDRLRALELNLTSALRAVRWEASTSIQLYPLRIMAAKR